MALNQRVLGSSPSASTISFKDLVASLEKIYQTLRMPCKHRVSTQPAAPIKSYQTLSVAYANSRRPLAG